MAYEDIIAGTQPLPDVFAGGGGMNEGAGASDNWLSDLTSAASSIASGIGSFFQNQQAIKGAMTIASAASGQRSPLMNYPGLGYSASPLLPYGALTPSPLSQAGMFNLGGPSGLTISDQGGGVMQGVTGGGSSTVGAFTVSTGPRYRAQRIITQQAPNGRIHLWYHIGGLDAVVREGLRAMGYGRARRRRRGRGRFC